MFRKTSKKTAPLTDLNSERTIDYAINLPFIPITKILFSLVILLLIASLIKPFGLVVLGFSEENLPAFFRLTDELFAVNSESNIPTWFSSVLLLCSAIILALIAAYHRLRRARYALHWTALSIIFLWLSADETAQLHEKSGALTNLFFNYDPDVLYGWTVFASVIVFVVLLSYLGFLRALPAKTRKGIVISGILFVGGALGLEMVASVFKYSMGSQYYGSIERGLLTHFEELLEFTGIIFFLRTLLEYIAIQIGPLELVAIKKPIERHQKLNH